MVTKLREVDVGANRDKVVKKINSLRTAYNKARKEYNYDPVRIVRNYWVCNGWNGIGEKTIFMVL